eukprot:5911192-Pleurochrysis_carterae.AAC.1
MSCVILGDDAPNVHWSKKMRSTPTAAAGRARSRYVDMSTRSSFPSIANRECLPRDTGDSNAKCPPRVCVASAMRTQFATRALARITVAGSPSPGCGIPIGCALVRRTWGSPGSKRAADHVEHGGDENTATHKLLEASSTTRSATSLLARSWPMPPRS